MASILSGLKNLFSGGGGSSSSSEAAPVRYKEFDIVAAPYKDGSQWRLAGVIRSADPEDDREHHFIRSDVFSDEETAKTFAVRKGQLIIDQSGTRILEDPGIKRPVP